MAVGTSVSGECPTPLWSIRICSDFGILAGTVTIDIEADGAVAAAAATGVRRIELLRSGSDRVEQLQINNAVGMLGNVHGVTATAVEAVCRDDRIIRIAAIGGSNSVSMNKMGAGAGRNGMTASATDSSTPNCAVVAMTTDIAAGSA